MSSSLHTPTRRRSLPDAGLVGFGLAVFYAVFVRFYQAAGGTIGLGGSVPAQPAELQMASYGAGLLILLAGVACLFLTRPGFRAFPAWLPILRERPIRAGLLVPFCAVPVLLGGLYAMVHGVSGVLSKLLELAGAIDIHYPTDAWEVHNIAAMVLWDLLFYEPWFLMFGLTLVLSVRRYARDLGVGPRAIGAASWVGAVLVVIGSAMTVWMMATGNSVIIG